MKYTIAKVIDSEYEDNYLAEVDVFGPFKRLPRKIRGIIFNQINKINHPCICGIINRHIMPEPTGPWGLDVFGPRKCLRCGEEINVTPLFSSALWAAFNTEAEIFSKWAELSKISILPSGTRPVEFVWDNIPPPKTLNIAENK